MASALIARLTAAWDTLRQRDVRWVLYGLASVIALGSDAGLFLLLLAAGATPLAASSIGYCVGILAHWLVSSRVVFADSAAERGSSERTRQKALFIISAGIGLGITTAIVTGGSTLGLDPRIAKLLAIGVSFIATYLLRRHIVFRTPAI